MVRPLADGEAADAVASLAEAFQRETISTWLFRDPDLRRLALQFVFTETLAALPAGGLVDVTDDLGAVAVWRPPEAPPTRPELPDVATADQEAFFDAVYGARPPTPFWYLEYLGARVGGTGAGSSLLEHRLLRLPAETVTLWTGTERNVGFYGRHGFAVASRHDVPGATGWWLVRD
jgi:hypothetical protein